MLHLSDFTFSMLLQKHSEIVSIQNSNATPEKLWPHCVNRIVRSAIKNCIFQTLINSANIANGI